MGIYLNPGNKGFQEVLQSEYVDKTGMIALVNKTVGTRQKLTCISRPRRFGKSFAVQMLCAYYDCSCDSRALFDDKEIARTEGYLEHLNQYHVINLDITTFISAAGRKGIPLKCVPNMMVEAIQAELGGIYPECASGNDLTEGLVRCVDRTGRRFIFIIDEWDALIREAKNDAEAQKRYLDLLREWFKSNNFTPQVVAAAYMTGILPIKKDGSQSAISDFTEYPILEPEEFAEFTGFTEDEVKRLCERHGMNFEDAKEWYDGYDFPEVGAVYNPYSVMLSMRKKKFGSYWRKTSAAESLMTYINMDFEGLQEIISRLISGEEIEVDTDSFENDFETFKSSDDVLTLLTHLGYLTWCEERGTARIPNEEIRAEFRKIMKGRNVSPKWATLIGRSQKLLEDTIAGNPDEVVKAIEAVRTTQYAPTFYRIGNSLEFPYEITSSRSESRKRACSLFYNNEQALRYVIKFAYITAVEHYLKVEELPSGHGIADVVFIPKQMSKYPAMVVELKWNKSSEGAIGQIKEKNYPAVIKDYGGEIVLVGINYNEKTGKHNCLIERV